jgi:hypothetical protein
MAGRNSPGAVNVRMESRDIGFVIPNGSGKWDGYADFKFRAGSTKIGTFSSKAIAINAVQYAVATS